MRRFIFFVFFFLSVSLLWGQDPGNYDELKVPSYTLPDPLVFQDGSKVVDSGDWCKRRKEIYQMFSNEIYGIIPGWHGKIEVTPVSRKENVFDGLATREEVMLHLKKGNKHLDVLVLIYIPRSAVPVPVFLGYNFYGNQTVTNEPDVMLTHGWVRNNNEYKITAHKATEGSRGLAAAMWPIKEILLRGYGLVTLNYGDVDPDDNDGFTRGANILFGQKRDSASCGKISVWAWGLSRVMDYLETNKAIDARKVAVIGHSRLGKTALWAGASDPRFAMIFSNNSGRAGAALTRRIYGEPLDFMHSAIPFWFCDNFGKYTGKENLLPVDQHELLALIAPRPVYVASAEDDLWADPKGEFLSCVNASPVYRFLGGDGFPAYQMPPVNYPIWGSIGYHIRSGGHNVTLYDWQCFMNFADFHFKKNSKKTIVLYASPEGQGDDCSKQHPGSLISVRNKVRSMLASMSQNIVVNLRGGTYRLESTFKLSHEDSGKNGFTVTWQAYPNEIPVLSGGKPITGWTLYDPKSNIWKTNVGSSSQFRQLYVNGVRAIRARTPNMTCYLDNGPYNRIFRWNNFHPVIAASLLANVSNHGQIEFCVNKYWQHFRYRIGSYSLKGDSTVLSFQMPEAGISPQFINDNAPFILENAFEFLDAEGEWYLESGNGDLYYKPRRGEDMSKSQVIAPVLETIMNLEGTPSSTVHHLRFKGITFEHSNWLGPNERGYTCAQAAIGMVIPGMVEVSNANHVIFERNCFKHAGGYGLVLKPFSNFNAIIGNAITDISANGLVIDPTFYQGDSQVRKDKAYPWMVSEESMPNLSAGSNYDVVKNNLIEFCGRDYRDAVGIYASFPNHLLIEHNEIRNLPYSGISNGWSWGKEKTPHRDGEVCYNKIHDVCQVNSDGGAIYNLGTVSGNGTRIHHNYTSNVNSPNGWAPLWVMAGLYCDGPGANNVLLDFNVIDNCNSAFQNGTHTSDPNLHYTNNYWQCPRLWNSNGAGGDNEPNTAARESENVKVVENNWPIEAISIMKDAGIEPEYLDILTSLNKH